MPTTLAHLSDLHILDLTGVTWTRYLNKRVTGAVNLALKRGDAHPLELAEALVADVCAVAPDHVAITGDISNLAFASEFAKAAEVLAPLGGYDKVSVIPGNHDVYTRGSKRAARFEKYFGHLMWPEGPATQAYPWVKQVGDDLTLVGFRSAHPVAPLFAHGWVDADQLAVLRDSAVSAAGRFLVALLHHNLHQRSARKTWMHGLRNRDQVLDACSSAGVGLMLHGHTHTANRFRHNGMPVVGCGSSTWRTERPEHVARYNLYHIDAGELVDIEVRVYDEATGRFASQGSLTVP